MNNNLDWTDIWDQNSIAEKANSLVDTIVQNIYNQKLEIHKQLNLNMFELIAEKS